MNTFFREDIPDSVGDTFLIETNCPYQFLLCDGVFVMPRVFLLKIIDKPLDRISKFFFVF